MQSLMYSRSLHSVPLKEVILQSQLKPSHCCKQTPWFAHESSWHVVLGPNENIHTEKRKLGPLSLIGTPFATGSHKVVANISICQGQTEEKNRQQEQSEPFNFFFLRTRHMALLHNGEVHEEMKYDLKKQNKQEQISSQNEVCHQCWLI